MLLLKGYFRMKKGKKSVREKERERERERVCVCKRERERERDKQTDRDDRRTENEINVLELK